jgi:CubicO group peptidase (beta-lactamase class C family)
MVAVIAVCTTVLAGCSSDDPGPATDAADVASDDAPDFSEVDQVIDGFVADEGLEGAALVVVDRDEGVVHEHYAGDFGPDRVSLIASSSKMLTAGILMRLDDQGLLDVDAPVAEVVDWGAGNPEVTPVQLVSNSSGLVGLIDEPTFPPYLCQYLAVGTLQDCAATIFTTTDDDDRVVPPDTEFRYGGGQWQVAGAVAEVASGQSWAQLVESTYVEPCGVDSLGYNNHFAQRAVLGDGDPLAYPRSFDADPATLTPTMNPNMEGGAYVDPLDYAELLLMHLRGGRCGDTQVLSEAAVDRMHADRIGPTYDGDTGFDDRSGYGLGWWILDGDDAVIEDGGAFGSVPWLDLDDGYGVYLLLEDRARTGARLAEQVRPLIHGQMTGD